MKKFLLSAIVLSTFILYILFSKRSSAQSNTDNSLTALSTSKPQSIAVDKNQNSKYKDGEYTGNIANAFYGNVQVKVTIENSKLTDVQFLLVPNSMGHTMMVSKVATPILRQEAIQAQSAKVNIVSGATDTSQAFIESLSSALSQAV